MGNGGGGCLRVRAAWCGELVEGWWAVLCCLLEYFELSVGGGGAGGDDGCFQWQVLGIDMSSRDILCGW